MSFQLNTQMVKVIIVVLALAMTLLPKGVMAQRQGNAMSAADKIQKDQMNAFIAGMGDVMSRLQTLNEQFYKVENRDSIAALMQPLEKIWRERQSEYMKNYPSTALTASFLGAALSHMSLTDMKEAYGKLDETARETTAGKNIANEIATIERVSPGKPAPEIAKNDFVTGKPFSLSSLKGKVVLLDFWASWCKPCRASNPHVKALYDKYKKKGFDVVYIADNDSNPEEALKAIEQDGIQKYHHVLRGLVRINDAEGQFIGYDKSQSVSEQYEVHFLPTKYLINRDGNIIDRVDDKTLDEKLKEIFGF